MSKIDDAISMLKKVVEAITTINTALPAESEISDEEKIESLKLIIEEQKQDCSYLLHIYNRMRAAEGLLLTATFGIVAYLYHRSDGQTSKTSIADRLFFPHEDYGKIIYLMAAAFFIYGLVRLMLRVFGKQPWMTTYEIPKDNYSYKTLDVLEYYKKRHDECLNFNGEKYYKRKEELNFLFYSILVSAIILIVIKTLT
jgi:hypothetical protein